MGGTTGKLSSPTVCMINENVIGASSTNICFLLKINLFQTLMEWFPHFKRKNQLDDQVSHFLRHVVRSVAVRKESQCMRPRIQQTQFVEATEMCEEGRNTDVQTLCAENCTVCLKVPPKWVFLWHRLQTKYLPTQTTRRSSHSRWSDKVVAEMQIQRTHPKRATKSGSEEEKKEAKAHSYFKPRRLGPV